MNPNTVERKTPIRSLEPGILPRKDIKAYENGMHDIAH